MITRPPFESELQSRMALGQERLQREYAQNQQLIDLLALQKLNKEKADAARSIQASMQTNPATVKDQLEQQLMTSNRQGIAGMMPGVQMQGQRMAQAQARKAAGLTGLASPNMARMADGGIVAFDDGGDVDSKDYKLGMPSDRTTYVPPMDRIDNPRRAVPVAPEGRRYYHKPSPEEGKGYLSSFKRAFKKARADGKDTFMFMGKPYHTKYAEEMAAGGMVGFDDGGEVTAAEEYLRLREKLNDPNTPPEAKQTIEQIMQDMKRMSDDESRFMLDVEKASGFDPAKEYEESMGGMYGGGIVGYAPGGLLSAEELQLAEEAMADRPVNTPPTVVSPAERREQREAENAASRARYEEERRKREELAAMGLTIPEINDVMERGEQAATQTPEMSEEKLESILSMMKDPNDYSQQEVPIRETLTRYEEGDGDASTVMGQTSVDDILAQMESLTTPAAQSTDSVGDISDLAELVTNYGKDRLDPGYPEAQRTARETAAEEAYAVPEELKQLYADRQAELESLKRTPEDIRKRELAALLGGLASSPYIARSGTQAYRGMQRVRDEARQENIATAEKKFDMARELQNLDRTASVSAFKEGLTALSEANSAQISSMQTINNMIQGIQNRELQDRLAQQSTRLQTLQAEFQNELKKIDIAAGVDRQRQDNIQKLYTSINDLRSDLVESKTEMLAMFGSDPEAKDRINNIYDLQINAATNTVNGLASLLDIGTGTSGGTSGTPTLSEADSIVGIE